jgi:hypothetical protein
MATKGTRSVNFSQYFRSCRRSAQIPVALVVSTTTFLRWVLNMELASYHNFGNFWKMFGLLLEHCPNATVFLFLVTNL